MLKQFKKNPRIIVILIGITIVPILYSFFYLWAFWDPYGNLSSVPVAVVNEDKGATINGEQRNLGNEMVKKMKEGKDLKWVFTSNAEARAGVSAGRYYTAVFIPSTFSSDISTASTTNKKTPIIHYVSNEKANYTASKIISSAMTKVEEQTRLNVDQGITASLTDKLRAVPGSVNTLNDGLGKLNTGAQSLSSGIGQAASGASQVSGGATSLSSGLQALNSGAQSLSSGAGQAVNGANQLASGASSLSSGLQSLNTGARSLSSGIGQAADGVSTLSTGALTLQKNFVNQFTPGANQLASGLSQLLAAFQTTGSAAAPTLTDSIKQLDSGVGQLQDQFKATGSTTNPTLADSIGQLNTSMQSYAALSSATLYAGTGSTFKALQTAAGTNASLLQQLTAGVLQSYHQQADEALYSYATAKSEDALNNAAVMVNLYDAASVIIHTPTISESDFVSTMAKGNGVYSFSAGDLASSEQQIGTQLASTINTQIVPTLNQQNLVAAGQTLSAGTAKLATQFKTSGDPAKPTLYDDINTLKAGTAALAAQTQTGGNTSATLYDSVKKLSDGAAAIAAQTKTSGDASNPTLYDGITQLAAGSATLNSGFSGKTNGLKAGASRLAAGAASAASGSSTLNSGATQLAASLPALSSGASQLAAGASSAASGSSTLANGAQRLFTGFTPLQNGMAELLSGLVSAKNGVSGSIADANIQIKPLDGLDSYVSAPLKLQSSSVYHVSNYGTGFAPYFISISLWAGALVMIAGLALGKGAPSNPTQLRRFAMMRIAFYYVMSFFQGFVLSIFLPFTLHFQVQNMPIYMLANILIALTFVSVVLLCVTIGGVFGSFIAVVLMVFQLTSCGGTFPLETTPKFFRDISTFLPMTYSVRLLREVISGFHNNYAAYDAAFLLVLLAVAFVLIVIATHIQTTRSISHFKTRDSADITL